MKELKKINSMLFNEIYLGINGSKKVTCILDNFCVRYIVTVNGKIKSKREFTNSKKDVCFRNATRALNK